MTSDPTKAMKAVVAGRPFRIRFLGSVDLQYAADTADVFIRSAETDPVGAHVFNIHGQTVSMEHFVDQIRGCSREILSESTEIDITIDGKLLSAPAWLDDSAIRQALGTLPVTSIHDGVHWTMSRFSELSRGLLDLRDLDN